MRSVTHSQDNALVSSRMHLLSGTLTFFVGILSFASAASRRQTACPTLPSPLPAPTDLPVINVMPDPFTFFNNDTVASPDDWACRKAELMTLVQEYMYGYYPDHSQETVNATRNGDTIAITVSNSEGSGTFEATLEFPTNVQATAANPAPVVISAGGVNDSAFIDNGVALATWNLPDVASDDTLRNGVFWQLYAEQDIGEGSSY